MTAPEPGLRERRRQRTRQLISDLATRLFIERGFDAVTIAEVAAAAEVAKMTVTNHFPRKEDLVLDVGPELVAAPVRAVGGRAPGATPLDALRRFALDAVRQADPLIGFADRDFVRLIQESPRLQARLREIHDERERALAEVLAAEAGADRFTARAVAGQLCGAYRLLFEEVQEQIMADRPTSAIVDQVGVSAAAVFDLLATGLLRSGDAGLRR